MSYILEALKKAQAERQLGNAPTLHAPTLQSAESASSSARFSMPMLWAVLGMAVVIGVLLVLVWRPSAPVAAPALAAQPAASPATAVVAAARVAPSEPVAPTPLPAPVADLPQSVANLARASAPEPLSAQPQPQPQPQAQAIAPAKPTAANPASTSDEPVVNLRDLPEPIQRAIPPVTVGGYIYSKNAADRLLLVDKVLRHEGEEVAPGLLLEKLQPKEAVFNFRGYRYRIPY
jgi:general secretion pathway protein B